MTLSALQEELQRKLNESQAEAQLVASIPCIHQLASVAGADFKLRLVIDRSLVGRQSGSEHFRDVLSVFG